MMSGNDDFSVFVMFVDQIVDGRCRDEDIVVVQA